MKILMRVLSIVMGIVAGMATVMAGDALTGKLYPLPAGTNIHDKAQLLAATHNMPVAAFVVMLLAYALAALIAGAVATMMVRASLVSKQAHNPDATSALLNAPTPVRPALICGLVLTLGGVLNASSLAHPTWFVIANVVIYLPCTYAGYLLTKSK